MTRKVQIVNAKTAWWPWLLLMFTAAATIGAATVSYYGKRAEEGMLPLGLHNGPVESISMSSWLLRRRTSAIMMVDADNHHNKNKQRRQLVDEPEFCPTCMWHDGRTCGHRKQQLVERQHKDDEEAIALLNEPVDGKASPCLAVVLTEEENKVITAQEVQTAKQMEIAKEKEAVAKAEMVEKAEEDDPELLEAYRAIFCNECSWHGRLSCAARKQFLFDTYGTPELPAMQNALEKVNSKCLKEGAELPTAKKEAQFCESCAWAVGINCRKRVQFMIDKYHLSEKEGIDHAMLEGKCTET
jgi:hypothetical protein